ncbi:aminodeoxychorismate lyase [Nakamurella antarctica]|nr:aminodeoxychorismate lyase [Nakamurella antarctica]
MLLATLDGNLHDPNSPLIRVDDLGVLRGEGVFETLLVVSGQVRDLSEHLARLQVSAHLSDMTTPPIAAWHRGIDAVLTAWREPAEMVLRLTATRGSETGAQPTCFVTGTQVPEKIRQQREGISVLTLDRGHSGAAAATLPWLLTGVKSISYAVNMSALRYARAHGADDALFVGTDGHVLEGATAAVVVARGDTLITPPEDGILPSITVRRLFHHAALDGWTTEESPLTRTDLIAADGVWLVSSVRLLAPVTSIDSGKIRISSDHDRLLGLLRQN